MAAVKIDPTFKFSCTATMKIGLIFIRVNIKCRQNRCISHTTIPEQYYLFYKVYQRDETSEVATELCLMRTILERLECAFARQEAKIDRQEAKLIQLLGIMETMRTMEQPTSQCPPATSSDPFSRFLLQTQPPVLASLWSTCRSRRQQFFRGHLSQTSKDYLMILV